MSDGLPGQSPGPQERAESLVGSGLRSGPEGGQRPSD